MGNVLGIQITKKRTAEKQANRANPQISSIEDYYKTTVFLPFIDNFINQLHLRFLNHKAVFKGIYIYYNFLLVIIYVKIKI